jgi:hypothetical protein
MKQVYSVIAALLLVSLAVIANAQMLQMPMQIRPIEKIISQPLLISEYLALKASGSIFDDNNVTESIMGGGMSVTGSYFVEVKIAGNPFRLVVDTGSSAMLVVSNHCRTPNGDDCARADSAYIMGTSASYVPCSNDCKYCASKSGDDGDQICGIQVNYVDGTTIKALGTRDKISVGALEVHGEFGQLTLENKLTNDQVDGIWGLNNRSTVLKPVFDALVHRGVRDMFAMCLGAQGGVLMIGGMNEKYLVTDAVVNYATMDVATYRIPITQLMVEQTSIATLQSNYAGTVDSGTTLFVLPSSEYSALKSTMQSGRCGLDYMCGDTTIFTKGLCFKFNEATIALFPTIRIQTLTPDHQNMTLDFTPQMYFYSTVSKSGSACVGFGIRSSENLIGHVLIGDLFMRHFVTIYDRENSRIGFGPVNDCNYTLDAVGTEPEKMKIVIIVVGTFAVVLAVALIVFFVVRNRRRYALIQ